MWNEIELTGPSGKLITDAVELKVRGGVSAEKARGEGARKEEWRRGKRGETRKLT